MDGTKSSFWPSYVDIMTTLFAIMLVLFAVSYSRFKIKEKELLKYKDQMEEINSIYQAVDNIDKQYFEFNEEYLKHIFKINVNYQTKEFSPYKLKQDEAGDIAAANKVRKDLIAAGQEIKKTIENLQKNDSIKTNIKYLVVIEGQASKIPFYESEWKNNNTLSYLRSLKLYEFWRDEAHIDFKKMDKCELVICGSGEEGVPRDKIDKNNQRFLIHIVPVIGDIHLTKPSDTSDRKK